MRSRPTACCLHQNGSRQRSRCTAQAASSSEQQAARASSKNRVWWPHQQQVCAAGTVWQPRQASSTPCRYQSWTASAGGATTTIERCDAFDLAWPGSHFEHRFMLPLHLLTASSVPNECTTGRQCLTAPSLISLQNQPQTETQSLSFVLTRPSRASALCTSTFSTALQAAG